MMIQPVRDDGGLIVASCHRSWRRSGDSSWGVGQLPSPSAFFFFNWHVAAVGRSDVDIHTFP